MKSTSNIFVSSISDTSNYVRYASNILFGLISDTSNYVRITSNILLEKINDIELSVDEVIGIPIIKKIIETSNYVRTTSNILVGRINDTSNYVRITSNILIGRISDTSNYVRITSNILLEKINDIELYTTEVIVIPISTKINDTSNYIGTTSNILVGRINDTSNYIGTTSNILVGRISDTSNFVRITSNILLEKINDIELYTTAVIAIPISTKITETSNYIGTTSNILVGRINDTSNYIAITSNIFANMIKKNTSSQWTTSNNMIYYNTLNVGIGTYYPISKLHIYNQTSNNTSLIINNNSINNIDYLTCNISGYSFNTNGIYNSIPPDCYFIFKNEDTLADRKEYSFNIQNNVAIADILIVGGGGGGGRKFGGGGGGGALIYLENQILNVGKYTFKVGRGGKGCKISGTIQSAETFNLKKGENGIDSEIYFNDITLLHRAKGGGGGLGGNNDTQPNYFSSGYGSYFPDKGGSGGGTGGKHWAAPGLLSTSNIVNGVAVDVINNEYEEYFNADKTKTPMTILNNIFPSYVGGFCFGNIGAKGLGDPRNIYEGGGGGGAGEKAPELNYSLYSIGLNSPGSASGGAGKMCSITGTPVYYAGGGAGGTTLLNRYNYGGIGGGGMSYAYSTQSERGGVPNTGGGGAGEGLDTGFGGDGGSGIIIIRFKSGKMNNNLSSSLKLIRGKSNDNSVDYNIVNYQGTFKIVSYISNNPPKEILVIKADGKVGIGTSNPTYLLEVSNNTIAKIYNAYFIAAGFYTTYIIDPVKKTFENLYECNFCAKFNNPIYITNNINIGTSSDIRIKEDIQDINYNSALQMILAIELKTYKYIDKIEKGYNKEYGFIAQQIQRVIPDAVILEKSYIPNIMTVANYDNKIITLLHKPANVLIKIKDKIKCFDSNNICIEIEIFEIINDITFKIKDLDKEYTDNKIFLYGTYVDDFHTLSRDHIYTLNVGATHELHRLIKENSYIIKSREEDIIALEEQNVILNQNYEKLLKDITLIKSFNK